MPFFSIIIPTFNRAHILTKAIDSILSQSFTDYEIIIVDDGSTDSTNLIVSNYASDKRVIYFKKINSGVSDSRNVGASVSKGAYFIFLDSDDVLTNDALESHYRVIQEQSPDIVFGDVINYHKGVQAIKKARNSQGKIGGVGVYLAGAFCINKNFFLSVGGYDKNLKFGENTELSFRIRNEKYKYGFTDKPVLIYESSNDGGSKNLKNKIDSNLHIIHKHPDYFKKNPGVKMLYLQIIAVSYAKIKEWKNARFYFWKAYCLDVKKISTLFRLLLCFFPLIAKRVWKQ